MCDEIYLYQECEVLRKERKRQNITFEIPSFIKNNLNKKFELRPYQIKAFENFITHFESPNTVHPLQVLFHMATGSGKTLIMAGLLLYLYQKGYRNFLFFVNLSSIVKKTEDNFLNISSSKYLFNDEIIIEGERVKLRKVNNFQASQPDAINICFYTTQGLHNDMWNAKENSISFEDFNNCKTVLISDEAHHLNVDTKNQLSQLSKEERDNNHSWEKTVKTIFNRNNQNILLEFTATCDVKNPFIKNEYKNKIIFDYPLQKFYDELYSKEIKTLQSDNVPIKRAIQAIILSQYRLKVFQDNNIFIKPVVLFKSAKIADSKQFMNEFIGFITNLNGNILEQNIDLNSNIMQRAYNYFMNKKISLDKLAEELKEDFSEEHCISVNDDNDANTKQILLNSLEDSANPYRAIFEVKKLDEGWDVLNLFDIVRLYDTHKKSNKVSPSTISEAQLIGRGARYCPFIISSEQSKFQRKYDNDVTNELRICEELYYHCINNPTYIFELHQALQEVGLDTNNTVTKEYILKQNFIKDDLYTKGIMFINDRISKNRSNTNELLEPIKRKIYQFSDVTWISNENKLMNKEQIQSSNISATKSYETTIADIANINFAIINKALSRHHVYKFNNLKIIFPKLTSIREFITSNEYFGNIRIKIYSKYDEPPVSVLNSATVSVVTELSSYVSSLDQEYEGTKKFKQIYIKTIFKNTTVNYIKTNKGGLGFSQNDPSVDQKIKFDLKNEDWFAFTDNYGTSEEKAFVAYFRDKVKELKKIYSKIYLVRNERQMHIYSFEKGERFEPDYVLFLQKKDGDNYEQFQIFIESKGSHLLKNDDWKEQFLLQIRDNAVIETLVNDNKYYIWGFHFFNQENKGTIFDDDFKQLTNS